MAKRSNSTSLVELAETHNIALALKRLSASGSGNSWRRALYHAIAIADCHYRREELVKIREALELP